MIRLVLVDETTSGDRDTALTLDVPDTSLTLRDVIRARINEEVARHEATGTTEPAVVWRGFVRPVEAEPRSAGVGTRHDRKVDADAQCQAAFRAFERNGFLVLVGDKQITDLDEPVIGRSDTEVTFLKLIPLVGG